MSVSISKRVVHLRKKNKILLDKLEAHSSKIKSDLRILSELPRDKLNREKVHKVKDQCKLSVERSDSPQSRYNSPRKIPSYRCSAHSSKLKTLSNEDDTQENRKTENMDDINEITPRESSLIDESTDFINKIIDSRSQLEVVSLLDYSPKSTFLRKMKSKYLGYSSSRNSRSQRHQKSSMNSPLTRRTYEYEPQSYVDEVSISEESSQSKGDSSFEKLKNFINSNWLECHAENQEHYSDEQIKPKAKKKYKLNERLFTVPVDVESSDYVYCASCQEKVSLLDVDPGQLVVSVPSSLLFRNDSFAKKKYPTKLRTERKSTPSAKKLYKKPKPVNSMALRFQKGVQ